MVTAQAEKKQTTPPIDVGTAPKASGFQALELPKSSDTSQALKASEGSRLTEPFRVAGALAGSVFKAAYAMYDNARTEIRVANAAKEMAKFEPELIATGASAQTILDTWSQMATTNKNNALKSHMKALGGAAASIVGAHKGELGTLQSDITSILDRPVKEGIALKDCVGESGASHIKSLTTEEKKAFVEAYNELRGKLTDLNSLSKKVEDQARAFYESSVERFKAQSDFKPEGSVSKFYQAELKALDSNHSKDLSALADKNPTPDQIRAVGEKFTQELKELQDRTTALSSSLKSAAEVESKVEQTLKYLTDGAPAVGASDKSVVFVGAQAADKIADWVGAQTKEATEGLKLAKASNDPAAITAATEKLSTASEAVHKQLDDIAKLLSKINGGKGAEGSAAQSQEERILAKATEARVTEYDSFSSPLSDYVGLLRKEMESRITTMFTADAAGNYDVATGKKGLAIIDKYDDMLERAIEKAKDGGLTADEVKYAVEKIHGMLRDELSPPPAPPAPNRMDDIVEATKAAKDKELAPPKPSLWGRFKNWFANN